MTVDDLGVVELTHLVGAVFVKVERDAERHLVVDGRPEHPVAVVGGERVPEHRAGRARVRTAHDQHLVGTGQADHRPRGRHGHLGIEHNHGIHRRLLLVV